MTTLSDELGFSLYNTLMAVGFASLLALVVLPPRRANAPVLVRILETRPFVWAGLISYSVFLWHEPIVRWLEGHGLTANGTAGLVGNTLLLLALTVALSTVTYRWIELPALRQKGRASRRGSAPEAPAEQVQAAP
jgi:peptidoglycan/LPS O-acetylase OafA/YrhL